MTLRHCHRWLLSDFDVYCHRWCPTRRSWAGRRRTEEPSAGAGLANFHCLKALKTNIWNKLSKIFTRSRNFSFQKVLEKIKVKYLPGITQATTKWRASTTLAGIIQRTGFQTSSVFTTFWQFHHYLSIPPCFIILIIFSFSSRYDYYDGNKHGSDGLYPCSK